MRHILKQNKLLLSLTVFISILSSASFVFVAIIIQKLIDIAMDGDMSAFRHMVLISVGYLLLIGALSYIYRLCSSLLIRNVTIQLRRQLFQGIFSRNMQDFTQSNTADYLSALSNDIKLAEENYFGPVLLTLQNIFVFVISLIVLLYLSPLVTLILLGCMALMFVIPSLFSKALQNKQQAVSTQMSAFTSKLKDLLSGYEVIKSYAMNKHTESDFEAQNITMAKTKFSSDRLFAGNESVSEFLGYTTQFVVIFVAAYLIITGDLSAGMLVALVQLSGGFVGPVLMIMQNISKLQGVKPIVKRIQDFIKYKDESFTGQKQPIFQNELQMKNLSFAYQEQTVLKNIDLTIEKGKKYVIVGPSGCGKSTLVKLLSGHYAAYSGDIYMDNNNIKDLDMTQLQVMMATIHQQVYMFDSDVQQNICLYEDFSDQEMEQAIHVSGIYRFLSGLPSGLSSPVGENGSNLSGGQRQRIAVARALIRNKPILILDEGTSAIDAQTAYEIESKLLTIEDLTLITITHNLSPELLSLYDKVIYMEQGEIVGQGTLSELQQHNASFFRFQSITG